MELTPVEQQRPHRPAPGWGLRRAVRLWRLVVACWAMSLVCFLPAAWVVDGAVGARLGSLPEGPAPPGDALLILLTGAREVAAPFGLAVLSGLVTLWAWTVLWHAGVVNWALWAAGRRVRLGEVLGMGVVSWWRYARLSLTAAVGLAAALTVLWLPLSSAVVASWQAMAEARMIVLLGAGVVLSMLLGLVVWAATSRAAWLLGMPQRRSAVLAWLGGLGESLRTPLDSLGTVLLWLVPAVALSLLPLVTGMVAPATRAGWLLPVLGQLAAAARSLCWVGLFVSFAPVTGLLGPTVEQE